MAKVIITIEDNGQGQVVIDSLYEQSDPRDTAATRLADYLLAEAQAIKPSLETKVN